MKWEFSNKVEGAKLIMTVLLVVMVVFCCIGIGGIKVYAAPTTISSNTTITSTNTAGIKVTANCTITFNNTSAITIGATSNTCPGIEIVDGVTLTINVANSGNVTVKGGISRENTTYLSER